jgi:predicted tellurium resistance membrane protein TerC
MRSLLLCFAWWITRLQDTLFSLPFAPLGLDPDISGKDLVLLLGGAYLIIKGIQEIREKLSLQEEMEEMDHPAATKKRMIGLPQAVGTIALMDIIFSLDSVITAVALADNLVVMIFAVMFAITLMIIFADPIAKFINSNVEVKILALLFIVAVGLKLVVESLGLELPIEGSAFDGLDLMLYFGLALALILTAIQMSYSKRLAALKASKAEHEAATIGHESGSVEAAEPSSVPTGEEAGGDPTSKGDTR